MPRFGDIGGSANIAEVTTPTAATTFEVGKATLVAPSSGVDSLLTEAPADASVSGLVNAGTASQQVSPQGSDTLEGSPIIPAKTGVYYQYDSTSTKWSRDPGHGLVQVTGSQVLAAALADQHYGDGLMMTVDNITEGTGGSIILPHRNTSAATRDGWNEMTVVGVDLEDVLPHWTFDSVTRGEVLYGGGILFLRIIPVSVWPDNIRIAAGIREWSGVAASSDIAVSFGISARFFTSGTQCRCDAALGGTASAGATHNVSTASAMRFDHWSVYSDNPNTAGSRETRVGWRNAVTTNTGGYATEGANGHIDQNSLGTYRHRICIGAGSTTSADDGLQNCEFKLYAGWLPFPGNWSPYVL